LKVLGIIPARAGSKRLPGKNMKTLEGKPLVQWVIESAIKAETIDKVAVSSDDEKVLNLSTLYDSSKIHFLKRPPEISKDDSSAIEYVVHCLDYFNSVNEIFDVIVIIQPTSPFTNSGDIDATVNLLLKSKADTAVSIMKVAHDINPIKLKKLNGDRLEPFLDDEQQRMSFVEVPEVYVRNCSVYATKIENIKKGTIIGNDCRGYVMPRERSVDINDEFDLSFAEFLLQRQRSGINE
jgi:CMP-N,N'-diacetyllegionaminic acid synthase